MDSLRSLLPRVLQKRGLYVHAQAAQVVFLAQKWLQTSLPKLHDALEAKELSHQTLCIACKHSIAAQECQAVLPSLVEYLREQCGAGSVASVRLIRL